ncbi:hypothetical protein ACWIID_30140 [Streptomyces phaeochromogenes]
MGHRVLGYDVDRHRVEQITAGQSYVEDVASARRRTVLDSGAYSVTADAALAGFDIAVITVPTQLRDGVPDLTYVESCLHTVGAHLRPGATVVLESTTYPRYHRGGGAPYGAAKAVAETGVPVVHPDAVVARTSLIIGDGQTEHERAVHDLATGTRASILFTDEHGQRGVLRPDAKMPPPRRGLSCVRIAHHRGCSSKSEPECSYR